MNSLNTARLIGYIRTEFGAAVPLEKADAATFRNVASIASMLCQAAADLGA